VKPIILSSLLLLVPSILQSQSAYPWGPVDTITTGDTDDRNPALAHGTMNYGWSNGQWMAFERRTPTESIIAVKRLETVWDTSTTILSARPLVEDQRLPDISAG
jgi:hypothetical protein